MSGPLPGQVVAVAKGQSIIGAVKLVKELDDDLYQPSGLTDSIPIAKALAAFDSLSRGEWQSIHL